MPTLSRCRALRLIALSVTALSVAAAPASALTFGQLDAAFPGLADSSNAGEVLPAPIAYDPYGPANAVASRDGSGLYAVAPEGDALADGSGRTVDEDPTFTVVNTKSGPALAPRTGGLEGVLLPRATNGWLELGDGIRVRLVGRQMAAHATREGEVLYSAVGAGVDQLITLHPDERMVEEFLIVNSASRRTAFSYQLVLPEGARVVSKGSARNRVLTIKRAGQSLMRITAPVAVDAAGTRHRVALNYSALTGLMTVRVTPTAPITWPLAIDPRFAKTTNPVYPSFHMYWGETCGGLAQASDDYYVPSERSWDENFDYACVFNNDELVDYSANADAPGDPFYAPPNTLNGVTLKVNGDVAAGNSSTVSITSPANTRVWESGFRGHMGYIADDAVSCQLRIGRTNNGSIVSDALIEEPWDLPAEYPGSARNERFFAGYPLGGGSPGAWADFPQNFSESLEYDIDRGVDQDRHMFGYFTMDADKPAALVPANMPRSVIMRMTTKKLTKGADHDYRCSADGRWRVVFYDFVSPTVDPPSAIENRWYSADEVENGPNSNDKHPWRRVEASDDAGSGIYRAVSRIRAAELDSGVAATPSAQLEAMPCATDNVIDNVSRSQPCPESIAGAVPGNATSSFVAPFSKGAGPHRFTWEATDFSRRMSGESTVAPATASSTFAPGQPQQGWYWVDATPPSCTIESLFVENGAVRIVGHADEYRYNDGPGTIRRGSGIGRLRIYKIPRLATFNEANVQPVVNYSYKDAAGNGLPVANFNELINLNTAEIEGDFQLVVVAEDGVNHKSVCMQPPVDCNGAGVSALNVFRGASGVLARWSSSIRPPGSAGREETRWMATVTDPNGSVRVESDVTQARQVYVEATPSSLVQFQIVGQCTPFRGQPIETNMLNASEFVDARPSVDIETPWERVDSRPGASKFRVDGAFDPVYERLSVRVSDADGFTAQRTGTNHGLANTQQRASNLDRASDRARVVVRITPNRAASNTTDSAPAADAYVIWEIGNGLGGAPHRYWLAEGAPPANVMTLNLAALAPCTAGTGRLSTANWTLDCVTSLPVANGSTFDLDLDLRPRDESIDPLPNTAERFPTPDREYLVDAAVRDQRQEADSRFLFNDAGRPANDQISAADSTNGTDAPGGFINVGTLVVDREQPTGDIAFGCNARPCVTIGNTLHVRDEVELRVDDARDVNPAATAVSPNSISWTGLGQVWFDARSTVDPTLGFDIAGSGGPAACNPATPHIPTGVNQGSECRQLVTTDPVGDIPIPNGQEHLLDVHGYVVDVARNRTVLTDNVMVDRRQPIIAPIAIKGASGVAAAWPMPIDISPPLRQEWSCDAGVTWSLALVPRRAGWLSSEVCAGDPGTMVQIDLRITDAVGNVRRTFVARRVDQRPEILTVGNFSDPQIWNDAWDEPRWDLRTSGRPDRRNDDLHVTLRDRDDIVGVESVDEDRVADIEKIDALPVDGDRGAFAIHVDDPQTNTEAWLILQPRSIDTDGTHENANATPQLEGVTAWLVDDLAAVDFDASVPVAGPGCQLGDNRLLTTGWWEFDCSRFAAQLRADTVIDPYGTQLDLELPLRALNNRVTTPPYPTPDDTYNVRGWVRDQRQPADNEWLAGAAALAPIEGTYPAAGNAEVAGHWLGLGNLRTDRIDPSAILTADGTGAVVLNRFSATAVAGQPVAVGIDVLAADVAPGAGQNTLTRVASGLDLVGVDAVRVIDPDGAGPQASSGTLLGWNDSCTGLDQPLNLAGTATQRCDLNMTFGNVGGAIWVEVDITIVDRAGNFTTVTRRLMIDTPNPGCGTDKGFAPLVDIPQGKDLQTITTTGYRRRPAPDDANFDSEMRTFATVVKGGDDPAGQSGFGNGLHCGLEEWIGTVDISPTAPWSPARDSDIVNLQTTQKQPYRPDLGEHFMTWRANVNIDGTRAVTTLNPPTAITSRVMIATFQLRDGSTRTGFVRVLSRMPAVDDGKERDGWIEVTGWVGTSATERRPIWETPDLYFEAPTKAKCMHGCENTPLVNP